MFYAFFNTGARLVVKMSECLNKMLHETAFSDEKSADYIGEIKFLYSESQENYRQTVKRLSRVFITPIDRESIHQLSVDLHAVAHTIFLVPRSVSRHENQHQDIFLQQFGALVEKMAAELEQMIVDIGTTKRLYVMDHAKKIYSLKREMETLYDNALKNLYQNIEKPAQFIRILEGYTAIKEVCNFCRNTAHTAEGVVLTHVG